MFLPYTSLPQKQQLLPLVAQNKSICPFSYNLHSFCQQSRVGSISQHCHSLLSFYPSPAMTLSQTTQISCQYYFNRLLTDLPASALALLHINAPTRLILSNCESDNILSCSKPSKILHLSQDRCQSLHSGEAQFYLCASAGLRSTAFTPLNPLASLPVPSLLPP